MMIFFLLEILLFTNELSDFFITSIVKVLLNCNISDSANVKPEKILIF